MKTLQGKIAVVTGGASGIGRATCLALAQAGCDLAISDIDAEGMKVTASQVEAEGRRATTHEVDVTDHGRMLAFAQEVADAHGAVHIVVNNAGIAAGATFAEQSMEGFRRVIDVNLWGVVHGCKVFLPHLQMAGEGHIVNISSVLGIVGLPNLSAYCTSKFAVRGLSEVLVLELGEDRIGVTCVHPGLIRTNIAASAPMGESTREKGFADGFREEMASKGAPPAMVADAIVEAIRKGHTRTLVCKETKIADGLARLAPSLTQWLISRGARRGEARMRERRGRSGD